MEDLKNTSEYKLAEHIENVINSTTFSPTKFAECIKFMHPYLQATFFRVIRASLQHFADPEKRVDGRNEHCKNIAQSVLKATKDIW